MSLADKLGNFDKLGWVWNYGPWWAFFMALSFGWIMMHVLAVALERRWLFPREQYYSFYYADLVLPIAVGLIASMGVDLHGGWYQARWFQWAALAAGLVGGLGQVALEIPEHKYTWQQFLSPTKVWHNAILWPIMAYWIITGTAAVTTEAGISPVRVVIVYLCLMIWLLLALYDGKPSHIKPRAHVNWLAR